MSTIPAILSAETTATLAVASLRATAAVLQHELAAFLSDPAAAPTAVTRLDALLFAAQDAICNVERARDEVADLKDEYAHNAYIAARRAA